MKLCKVFFCLSLIIAPLLTSFSQSQKFSVEEYKSFLANNKNMSCDQLTAMYDAGKFLKSISNFANDAKYLDSIEIKYAFTNDEKSLLAKNGFVVTERVSQTDFIQMYLDIFHKDLPILVTTDAILNALHKSYDAILKSVELEYLIPKLKEFLNLIHGKFSQLEMKYSSSTELPQMLKDADLYLTVARYLLDKTSLPYYQENSSGLSRIIQNIEALEYREEPLFSTEKRKYDYSQFEARGHYTDEHFPQLADYFKAMIWLGKTELYLIAPKSADTDQEKIFKDVQRQTIDSYLISELIEIAAADEMYNEFESVITAFVGEQDNVTLPQLRSVFDAVGITTADELINVDKIDQFTDTLAAKPFSEQKILSQILMSEPTNPEQTKPASAFLIFGQRFVVDSYVTSSVVFSKIIFNNEKVLRMLPSSLDILFALGNSASAQLLKTELEKYNYSSNLSALRYLIDSYDENFWTLSVYNLWLSSIKSLNPPDDRTNLPLFMQTAAWWQQKINTQLSSWIELRHDNLLYAKQSYSSGITCSFPYGYVEPVPQFYASLKMLAEKANEKFIGLPADLTYEINYFENFASCMDTLQTISQKELDKIELDESEKHFLKTFLYETPIGCEVVLSGWFRKLHYENPIQDVVDHVTADYHTAPTDEFGNMVGWVKHAGTGMRNLCVVVAEMPGVGNVAFAGVANSFYEITTENFLRLSDEQWKETYLEQSLRPDWTNIYLANNKGEALTGGANLVAGVEEENSSGETIPVQHLLARNYPNPFNAETIISFAIPSALTNSLVELNIYNVQGELVKKLFKGELQSGNYWLRWNGSNDYNQIVSSGVYFYELRAGTEHTVGKMNLVK